MSPQIQVTAVSTLASQSSRCGFFERQLLTVSDPYAHAIRKWCQPLRFSKDGPTANSSLAHRGLANTHSAEETKRMSLSGIHDITGKDQNITGCHYITSFTSALCSPQRKVTSISALYGIARHTPFYSVRPMSPLPPRSFDFRHPGSYPMLCIAGQNPLGSFTPCIDRRILFPPFLHLRARVCLILISSLFVNPLLDSLPERSNFDPSTE